MKNNKGSNWGFLENKWFYIIFSCVFFGVSSIFFIWGHEINYIYLIDNELVGNYGDFIGGVLGTIFTLISVLLVIKTFKYQQSVTSDNKIQSQSQRFNDLFFELLKLYQSEVKELCGYTEKVKDIKKQNNGEIKARVSEIQYNDKDFFDEEKEELQKSFKNDKSYNQNLKLSINYYMLFYINNRSKISAYFRTLYRIYELIDSTSLIDEEQKKEYCKIIRAQLTDSELFFLRYNAMTIYGSSFVDYLNKYNVLKHLPAFDLLEFKDWWKNMDAFEREGTNIILSFIRIGLKELFKKNKEYLDNNEEGEGKVCLLRKKQAKFQISLNLKGFYDFKIEIAIDGNKTNYTNEYLGLLKLTTIQIQQLLDCFIKELFIYSNFEKYNKSEEIETYSDKVKKNNNVTIINSGIRNKNSEPLIINYADYIDKKVI